MAGFVGRYEHSLDTKGRVILPAKFRGQFERGGYLTQNSEGCLALWTPGEFERRMESMQEKADAGRADRNRARIWASNSAEVEIDRQGRMPIPPTCGRSPASTPRCSCTEPSTGSSCGIRRRGRSGCCQRRAGCWRTRTSGEAARRSTGPRHNRKDTRQDREHDDKDTQDALDHVQLLDRRAGRPLHPPPRWSFGSPPPSRPTGRGAADGPLVRTHSRAARRGGLAVRIRAPWRGRRRDRRRGRPCRGVARGVSSAAHRRVGPRSRRAGGGPGAFVRLRGPGHAGRRPVLLARVRGLRSRVRASRACSSTWASAPLSSTGPIGVSPSARTGPSTCGWTRPPARPLPTW